MSTRVRRALAVALVALGACGWAGCEQLFGIDEAMEVAAPGEGGVGVKPPVTNDAANENDGAPRFDAGPGGDATTDASLDDGGPPGDSCAAIVARMLSAPIVPPGQWAGLDLTNGGLSNDVPGSGGLTLVQEGLLACASAVEPTTLAPDASPYTPGYRAAWFGDAGPDGAPFPLQIETNLQSGSIYQVIISNGYTGTLSFHRRTGGRYGTHSYEVSIGAAGPYVLTADGGSGAVAAGAGSVTRDGVDFPADWSLPFDDAGVQHASAWINELYDGIVATYSPATDAIDDCYSTPLALYDFEDGLYFHQASSCLVLPVNGFAYFGVRSLALYLMFNVGTNQTNGMYNFWLGSITSCSTQTANLERMNYAGIQQFTIGGLNTLEYVSNPYGLTETEANTVECNGIAAAPEDDGGYSAVAWGPSGEVYMEYDSTGLNYKNRREGRVQGAARLRHVFDGARRAADQQLEPLLRGVARVRRRGVAESDCAFERVLRDERQRLRRRRRLHRVSERRSRALRARDGMLGGPWVPRC